jgi:hypothetical protein
MPVNGVPLEIVKGYAIVFLRNEIKELEKTLKGNYDENITKLLKARKEELEIDYKKLTS